MALHGGDVDAVVAVLRGVAGRVLAVDLIAPRTASYLGKPWNARPSFVPWTSGMSARIRANAAAAVRVTFTMPSFCPPQGPARIARRAEVYTRPRWFRAED